MRTDARFKNRTEREILDRHRAIVSEIKANLPRLFGRLPDDPLEVRAFDPVAARSSPTGEYYPAASDGSRSGIFFVNTSDPTTRPTYTMQALAYHEAIPGHHLQGSFARLTAKGKPVPPFRRYFYFNAFDEGWALYSEGLPGEIGLYTDPYAEFGRLNYDSLRWLDWLSTPACTTSTGAASRRSPTWRKTPPCRAMRSRMRSTATSPGRARPWPTRSASSRFGTCAPGRKTPRQSLRPPRLPRPPALLRLGPALAAGAVDE